LIPALRREFFREMRDRHKPNKLIKNQNASMINADKLKAQMSETIISSAPPAFSSEYLGDELGSLSSCRSKYATTMSRTPMNPARSNKWKVIVIATAIGLNLAFQHLITTTAMTGSAEHSLWPGTCLSDTWHEIVIKLGSSIS
jgi:hypothetical protein